MEKEKDEAEKHTPSRVEKKKLLKNVQLWREQKVTKKKTVERYRP